MSYGDKTVYLRLYRGDGSELVIYTENGNDGGAVDISLVVVRFPDLGIDLHFCRNLKLTSMSSVEMVDTAAFVGTTDIMLFDVYDFTGFGAVVHDHLIFMLYKLCKLDPMELS